MTEGVRDQLNEVWQQQRRWSQTANRLKSSISKFRLAALLLTLCGAALAATATTLATRVEWAFGSRFFAATAAFAVGMSPTLRFAFDKKAVSDWIRARSISEALKSEMYMYLAGVRPYRGPDRQTILAQHLREVLEDGADLARSLTAAPPATARPLPAVTDVGSYVRIRLVGEMDGYYRPKAQEMDRRLTITRRIQISLAAIGAALGALTLTLNVHTVAWIGVVTTAATAVAAYAAASRYLYQFIEYSRTAQQLNSLLDGYLQGAEPRTEEDDDRLVARCEHVISIQNEAWMVKWLSD